MKNKIKDRLIEKPRILETKNNLENTWLEKVIKFIVYKAQKQGIPYKLKMRVSLCEENDNERGNIISVEKNLLQKLGLKEISEILEKKTL